MSATTPIYTFFTYLHVLALTPWILTQFTFEVGLCMLPWTRPTKQWSVDKAVRVRIVALLLRYWSLAETGDRSTLQEGPEGNRFEVVRPKSAKLYAGPLKDAYIQPNLVGMTWTPSRPPPPELVRPDMVVALHLHGGAYVIGNGRDEDTGYLANTLIQKMGCTHVCAPQYRISSRQSGRFPAPLQDALTAYLCLVHEKGIPASQIVFSGDSAGANLALGLLRYIHDHGEELDIPLPGAVTLWSPWVDIGGALHQDIKMSPNYKTDYLNGYFSRWGANSVSGYGIIDASGPYLSPLHHPFALDSSIPVFVHAGEAEVLWDDIKAFCRSYREVGWNIKLATSPNCPHDILLLGPKMGFDKEAEEAVREAREFLCGSIPLRNE